MLYKINVNIILRKFKSVYAKIAIGCSEFYKAYLYFI